MLTDKIEYKKSLADLWHRVFGDSYDFIELIFKAEYDSSIICFAHLDCGRAVSALYLIKNTLKFKNELFEGYYLYAAATLPEYRKSGIMSGLIREAQDFSRESGADFISLVPSEEGLYGYYSRFGFRKAMYRYENEASGLRESSDSPEAITSADEILGIRGAYEGNIISFHPSSFGYALDCLLYSGFCFKRLSQDSYLLFSEDDGFSEFMSSKGRLTENEKKLPRAVRQVTSPFALRSFDVHYCKPYGMLYPINDKLKKQWSFTDIYMNIALD